MWYQGSLPPNLTNPLDRKTESEGRILIKKAIKPIIETTRVQGNLDFILDLNVDVGRS